MMNYYKYSLFFSICALSSISFLGCSHDESAAQIHKSPIKVHAMVATLTNQSIVQKYSGTIEENRATAVSFSGLGTISTLNVHEGQSVKKGDLIGSLDDTAAKSSLEIAEATLVQAEAAYKRMEKLHESKSISDMQWTEVESKYKQAVSSVKMAKKSLADCKLYAPASGIISDKNAEIGQNTVFGQIIFKIIDISKVKAKFFVPENEVENVHIGDKVQVIVGALKNNTFEGKITEKNVKANVLTRSYEINATLENKKKNLLPGMIMDVFISKTDSLQGISIPNSAVMLNEKNNTYVWKIKDGLAERADVQLSFSKNQKVLAMSGIMPGDTVITNGAHKVGSGQVVEPEI